MSSMLVPMEVDIDWMPSIAFRAFYIEAKLLIWTQNSDSVCLSSQLPFWVLCLVLQVLGLQGAPPFTWYLFMRVLGIWILIIKFNSDKLNSERECSFLLEWKDVVCWDPVVRRQWTFHVAAKQFCFFRWASKEGRGDNGFPNHEFAFHAFWVLVDFNIWCLWTVTRCLPNIRLT